MSSDNTFTVASIAAKYNTDEKAREFMERLRWPNGPVCPHCGSVKHYRLTPKPTSKRPGRPGLLKCGDCRRQYSVTVGSVFEGSHVPLHKWLLAIAILVSSKKGHSALQLKRELELGSYKTAWFMFQRLRHAMSVAPLADKLKGIVEADETYVGGRRKGSKRGRSLDHKTPVVALIQRDGDARAFPVDRVTAENLKGLIRQHVDTSARIMTDEFSSYRGLDTEFHSHETVSHGKGEYARGDVNVNSAEGFFALLKRGIVGQWHSVSPQHLHRYVTEAEWHWNTRKATDTERAARLIRSADGQRLKLREPIGRAKS